MYWGRGGGEMARRDEVRAPLSKGRRIAGCCDDIESLSLGVGPWLPQKRGQRSSWVGGQILGSQGAVNNMDYTLERETCTHRSGCYPGDR